MAKTAIIDADKLTRQLVIFEGSTYPDVELKLAGGITGSAEDLDLAQLRIGDSFDIQCQGEVVSKRYALKRDMEGMESRTLVITLKVDQIPHSH